ncbi:MAG: molybdate ABC transporter substrate-binding protein [Mariprofundus sp.]
MFRFLILMLCIMPTQAMAEQTLTVAAASSVLLPVQQLAIQFEREQHIRVKLVSGATGMLYAQIEHGAPFDILMSADAIVPAQLRREKKLPESQLLTYAGGRLYLCVREGAPDINRLHGRIAMAEPGIAPYGRAAEEALRATGAWPTVKEAVIYTSNVLMTASYLQQGFVDAAFVASSSVGAQAEDLCQAVNKAWYTPIRHRAVILHVSQQSQAWISFIRSPEAQKVWQQAGFITEIS